MERLTFNLDTPKKRVAQLEGRDYLVVPMVMMVEGVLNGSGGPLYYPGEEIAKTPAVWNHKPIVVYHPESGSACSEEVINTRKVGLIMNASTDTVKSGVTDLTRLNAEAWLEVSRANSVDPRVLAAIETNKMMEVSTGLFTDNEGTPGVFNSKTYGAIARNYRADHLAILPDQLGACSIADGAGLLRNSAGKFVMNDTSYDDIRSALSGMIRAKKGDRYDGWIEDVFSGYFVYSFDGKLYRQSYNVTDGTIALVGTAVEVVREVVYKPKTTTTNSQENLNMDRKTLVDNLIKNTANGWVEGDREFLTAMQEDKFTKLCAAPAAPVGNEAKPDAATGLPAASPATAVAAAVAAGAAGLQPNAASVPAPAATTANAEAPKELTEDQWLAQAPPRMRDMMTNAKAIHNQQRAELITAIVANKANQFTQAQLEAKDTVELNMLAHLARAGMQAAAAPVANYFGAQGSAVAPVANGGGVVQNALPELEMDFSKK